jgi:DNA-binding XRE family transcriptional regulator
LKGYARDQTWFFIILAKYNVVYIQHFMLYLLHIFNVMKKDNSKILPKLKAILEQLGENINLARLRRRLTAEQVADRAGIDRSTLWRIEQGVPTVTIGAYLTVLFVLNLEKDLLKIAVDDELGRKLQDTNLITKKRGPKR